MTGKNILKLLAISILFAAEVSYSQSNFYEPDYNNDIKWSIEDFGKMWTFDNVPVEKFKQKYGFAPDKEWLEDVQKSALQFGSGCSAAFVSANGLIMTNHHCGRNQLGNIQKEGENLLQDGFYAATLQDERKVPDLYADQLVLIKDVTKEITDAMNKGKNDNEKIKLRDEKKLQLTTKYKKETGLVCKIVSLYNGGKFSLYGYKRYNDIRLVMSPDFQIAATGWDWDNFTYPRYELDFMFFRAYDENGNPVKSKHHFSWSKKGAAENEPVFIIGRPGKTDRLISFEQLEYFRDKVYKNSLIGFNEIYYAFYNLYKKHPERKELLNKIMGWENARKAYAGRLAGLRNNFIMQKKKKFENDLKTKVLADSALNYQYGHIWYALHNVIKELSEYADNNSVVKFSKYIKPVYYSMAKELVEVAKQKEKPDEVRSSDYTDDNIYKSLAQKYPQKIDEEFQYNLLLAQVNMLQKILGYEHPLIKKIYGSRKGKEAVNYLLSKTKLKTQKEFLEIAKLEPDEIKNFNDPFIVLVQEISKIKKQTEIETLELNNTLSVLNQQLGEVIYKVYGNKIPPDATSTLRISDGVIKGYEYNGTLAPGKTTFYGLWDRYFSFGQKTYPWGLHKRWQKPPEGFKLSTNVGFASTNDIVGGNSGSSIINVKKEVVGLVHDGNIESLAGHTIYLPENNRAVATDSDGLIQALKYIYKTDRLIMELQTGEENNAKQARQDARQEKQKFLYNR